MHHVAQPEDLRSVGYLKGASEATLALICQNARVVKLDAREIIATEEQPADGFFVVRRGKARIIRRSPDGREQTLRLLGPSESFGEVCVFDGGPFPASVETLVESEVIFVPSVAFRAAVLREPGLGLELLVHFARRLRAFNDLIATISLQTVAARLARYLYQLAREEGVGGPQGLVLTRSITVQDLASLLGSAREVVSRSLKTMAEDGILEVHRHEIIVRDLARLRALS